MKITLKQLEDAGACGLALDEFRSAVGNETADIEFNQAAQGLMLADPLWRQWLGWAYAKKFLPLWSMSRADLSGSDLSGANLSGANLRGANLNGSDLSKANLSGANLINANLFNANLTGATLREAIWNNETTWTPGFQPAEGDG